MLRLKPWAKVIPALKDYSVGDSPHHRWIPGDPLIQIMTKFPRWNIFRFFCKVSTLRQDKLKPREAERIDKTKESARKRRGGKQTQDLLCLNYVLGPWHQSSTDFIWFNAQEPRGQLISTFQVNWGSGSIKTCPRFTHNKRQSLNLFPKRILIQSPKLSYTSVFQSPFINYS